ESKEMKPLVAGAATFKKVKIINEKRFKYDRRKKLVEENIFCNAGLEQTTYHQHNVFNELTGEGDTPNIWGINKKMDTQGHAWFTKGDQGNTIKYIVLMISGLLQTGIAKNIFFNKLLASVIF